MARYKKSNAPCGGWIDTETNTSFTGEDEESSVYKEFVTWMKNNNNKPDEADPLPTIAPQPDLGTDIPSDTKAVTQDITALRLYLTIDNPQAAQTVTVLKLLIRLVLFVFKRTVIL